MSQRLSVVSGPGADKRAAGGAEVGPAGAISSTADIIAELKAGRIVVVVDDEDRENEGDLLMAAEFVTPEAINFMAAAALNQAIRERALAVVDVGNDGKVADVIHRSGWHRGVAA